MTRPATRCSGFGRSPKWVSTSSTYAPIVSTMSSYKANEDLENAMVNANNVIAFAGKLKGKKDNDEVIAIQSIGYSLHAIARALKEMNK